MDYSVVAYDGLPEDLLHVLASLEGKVTPKRWRVGRTVASMPLPIRDGLQGQFVCLEGATQREGFGYVAYTILFGSL